MKAKCTILVFWAAFLVLVMNPTSEAVNTRDIDRVRNKGVLDNEDLQLIDNFLAEAVYELVRTRDFTSVARLRTVILSRKSSQAQYAEQFSESAHKYISSGFKETSELTPKARKFNAILNLLILVDKLEDLRLTELAMERLNDENEAIRYWAVHSVTNSGIIKQLNSNKSANSGLASQIAARLQGLVEEACPDILALAADFAAEVNIRQGEDLLLQIADVRISKYVDWTVDYELLDADILKLLCDKISSGGPGASAAARRFGQLYSYVTQRYVKGQDFLTDTQKQQLASVLVETEQSCIGKLLGTPQSVIKRAVEQHNYAGLLQEHNRLLGNDRRAGRLADKLTFDYGKTANGSKRTAPLALPERPKQKLADKK